MLGTPEKRLALQAYEQILDLILRGRAGPGEVVNERRLADELGMSRTPVRDALLMLEGEGLLLRQGRALQIKQMRIEDYMDALQIRLLLEPAVARMAAGGVDATVTQRLRAEVEDILKRSETERADRALVREVDESLHGLLADMSGNPQLATIIRTLRRQTQMFDLRSMPERLADTCQEHLTIIAAVESGDGEAAASAMSAHLSRVRDSIVRRLTRT
ncbi:GntR family transcriptional regulator [Mangrovibrevibacter kandeliae]|uniref:GntR family transcriptional regulator n=1 Tax=Mangrovibrevibacter kandeliae TaxID=2968473 RepID=UPI002119756E|nr:MULTISPECIES: GntR family transcriptional regulator [unclassified Aurantimonas]MCQ8781601.1 GntR family transcriptional regulator [Aurantimonas sp. CSK15Z-1]MCW4114953.1 GntR family transcriptional regulator [Aurantimonas sp. MSK8Z-1]